MALTGVQKEILFFASPIFVFFGPVAVTAVGHWILG